MKRLWVIPVMLLVLSCLPSEAYTVILKNGKAMKGTLISENDEKIVFKDEQGLQFSLSKNSLDLAKMKDANAPPPAAPAAAPETPAPAAAPAAKKPARVYTAADLQTIRDRFSTSSGDAGEMVDPTSPAGYYKGLMEAVSRITSLANDLGGLLDGMNTDWEVASSTGRNPVDSIKKYKGSKAFTDLSQSIKINLSELQSLRDSMSPPIQGFQNGYDALNKSVESLYTYYDRLQQYSGDTPVPALRSELERYSDEVNGALSTIQAVPAPPEPEAQPSGDQPPGEQQQQSTESESQPPPQ